MNILVIRRDNIGDLICTTPLLTALRERFPDAHLCALVNSYNAPILAGNRDLDHTFVYRKAKHRAPGESRLRIWWQTLRLMLRIRRTPWDIAIVATTAYAPAALKFARWAGARRIIAYAPPGGGIETPAGIAPPEGMHEAEAVMQLARPLGVESAPGAAQLHPREELVRRLTTALPPGEGELVALHISARKPRQRWTVEQFAQLARRLHAERGSRFLLFWSPGPADHPQHPGDDDKAAALQTLCAGLPMAPIATASLDELIAGLALCDRVVCSDGGAMHVAAGLGKPIVCLFGNSSASRWHPWGVPYELLQLPSEEVPEITVDEVFNAYQRLVDRLQPPA